MTNFHSIIFFHEDFEFLEELLENLYKADFRKCLIEYMHEVHKYLNFLAH
jgi:hypothetical protein